MIMVLMIDILNNNDNNNDTNDNRFLVAASAEKMRSESKAQRNDKTFPPRV